jgi:2-methylfumaryl-CoA hydratase
MSDKIHQGRYFEDFKLNDIIQHATPRTITSGDCALYIALTGSRNPLHCSEPFAQSLGYKTTPVDDLLAFHIAFGKTVPDISVNAVANLGYADVQFISPIYVGDTLTTSSQVIGLKQNSSGKNGVVWVKSTTTNQTQEIVMQWVRWVMVIKHNLDAPAPQTVIPKLPSHIAAEQLKVPKFLETHSEIQQATGGQFWWEDYAISERINHMSGLTINDSDHTLATHLYQNNARLHFDAHMRKTLNNDARLVYGGVVISACRALSFEGLENAISLLAINGGTHANPSYAGDTIYTMTEVLDKWDLPSHHNLGALRLRMIGLKNCTPAELTQIKTEQGYQPNVVLDLDYTVLMPKKGS